MVGVDEVLAIVRWVVRPLLAERVSTAEADGRILAEPNRSPENVPPFRASTVDGFAVRAEDREPARRVVQRIMAGATAEPGMAPGTAARIMTGAPLPDGADAVVMIEYTHEEDGQVILEQPVRAGENIRPIGIDVAAGDAVLEAGTILGAAEIGLLMTLGFTKISCYRRPTVAVLSTGDELVEPSEPLPPGGIRDSNRYAIMAAVHA